VGQVDHVHDAEHERQPGGQQEQHQPELQAVERLLDEQQAAQRAVSAVRRPRASLRHLAQACT
jgi:hypothetical protein